jgi:hypothetical protein
MRKAARKNQILLNRFIRRARTQLPLSSRSQTLDPCAPLVCHMTAEFRRLSPENSGSDSRPGPKHRRQEDPEIRSAKVDRRGKRRLFPGDVTSPPRRRKVRGNEPESESRALALDESRAETKCGTIRVYSYPSNAQYTDSSTLLSLKSDLRTIYQLIYFTLADNLIVCYPNSKALFFTFILSSLYYKS